MKSSSARRKTNEADAWHALLRAYQAYWMLYDHGDVPDGFRLNPALSEWVKEQRAAARAGTLSPERRQLLEQARFVFEPSPSGRKPSARGRARSDALEAQWNAGFEQLVAFKQKFGRTEVQGSMREYRSLQHWIQVQRRDRKKGVLRADRLAKLEAIGFVWEGKAGPRDTER